MNLHPSLTYVNAVFHVIKFLVVLYINRTFYFHKFHSNLSLNTRFQILYAQSLFKLKPRWIFV